MARKRNPIIGRAWDIIGSLSITTKATVTNKNSIVRRLLLFKRTTKKRYRHYNNSFVGEYEFSPSDSPLIFHSRVRARARARKRSRFLCLLCGDVDVATTLEEDATLDELGMFPDGVGGEQMLERVEYSGDEEDDCSVDGRAERFIEKFYEEMRLQRQDSVGAVLVSYS